MTEFREKLAEHSLTLTSFSKLIGVSPKVLNKYEVDSKGIKDIYRVKIEVGLRVLEETGLVRPRLSADDMREISYFGVGSDAHFNNVLRFEKDFKRAFREDLAVVGVEQLDEVNRKRGRPTKNGGKNNSCYIRMTNSERSMLDYLSTKEEKTRTEVLMEALKIVYKNSVNKENDEADDGYSEYDDYYFYDDNDDFQ